MKALIKLLTLSILGNMSNLGSYLKMYFKDELFGLARFRLARNYCITEFDIMDLTVLKY